MEDYVYILFGIWGLGIIVAGLFTPITPKITRWILRHQTFVERAVPFVFIVWGGVIWVIVILRNDFSNVFAMVGASVIALTGVFFLLFFKRR